VFGITPVPACTRPRLPVRRRSPVPDHLCLIRCRQVRAGTGDQVRANVFLSRIHPALFNSPATSSFRYSYYNQDNRRLHRRAGMQSVNQIPP
ncbi:MAG: hypothetical protein U9Q78_07645, partial [Chloroflexota bacterium]|nr:hypothetical protein [Chloroflexota bacterium]